MLFLQNGGYVTAMTDPIWDTSWLLKEDSIPGRLLHTLVGYVQAPDAAQILAYLVTIAAILVLMRLAGKPLSRPRHQPAE
jgi:high-affinity iron transporter